MKRLIPVATGLVLLLFFAIAPAIAGQGTSEAEPNDTKDLADPIEGFVINGNIDEEDTDDWFVLEGQEGLQANFVIYFDDSEGLEVDFAVYSDDEEVGKAEGYGPGEAIACEIPGTCYIHVWRYGGEGDYTIKIGDPACQGESEIESNDSREEADLIPEEDLVINGFICEEDHDWFALSGQEGQNPTFTLTFDDSRDFEIDFEIYSDDELVATATDWDSPESLTCKVPGTCYVHVYHWEGEGEYTLEINPESCQGESEIEPNDAKEQADLIPEEDLVINGFICEEDHDWFALSGQEGQNPTFTLTFDDSGDFEVDFEIYSDDELVATGAEWDSPETLTCEVPGTCYIHVYHWEGEGAYTIEIEP